MLKGLSAILLAGISAGFIVGFVAEPERAAAAATPTANAHSEQNNAAAVLLVAAAASCTQTWPYYEQSCLRHNRRTGGAPTARVIPLNQPANAPVKTPVSKVAKLAGGAR